MIYAAAVRPANEPELFVSAELRKDVERQGNVSELHIDRGYLTGEWVKNMNEMEKLIFSKPWRSSRKKFYSKDKFTIDLANNIVICPQGKITKIKSGTAKFLSKNCDNCPVKSHCTEAKNGRNISIHANEALFRYKNRLNTKMIKTG